MRRLLEFRKDPWRDGPTLPEALQKQVERSRQRPSSAQSSRRQRPSNSVSFSTQGSRPCSAQQRPSSAQVSRPCSARGNQQCSPAAKVGVRFAAVVSGQPKHHRTLKMELRRESGSPAHHAVRHLRMQELRWNAHSKSWMPKWIDSHHLTNSKDNDTKHYLQKGYFDELPTSHMIKSARHSPQKQLNESTAVENRNDESAEQPMVDDLMEPMVDDLMAIPNKSSPDEPAPTSRPSRPSSATSRPSSATSRPSSARKRHIKERFRLEKLATSADLNGMPELQLLFSFYEWCIDRFHNLTRGWRILDQSLNMRLSLNEFLISLRNAEFQASGLADPRLIFNVLDRSKTGTVQYFHFDPQGALELGEMIGWFEDTFGSVEKAFDKFDQDRNGKLSLAEFLDGAKKHGFKQLRAIPHLYEMLDLDHDHKVTKDELKFMDAWRPPAWLKVSPDAAAAEAFKQGLGEKFGGNHLAVWRRLDLNCNFRISWSEFEEAAHHIIPEGWILEEQLPAIWHALDENLSGWLCMREWDSDLHELIVKFKTKLEEKHGSLSNFFETYDIKSRKRLYPKEFACLQVELEIGKEDCDFLFVGLDTEGKGYIKEGDLKPIAEWDLGEETFEHEFWDTFHHVFKKDERYVMKQLRTNSGQLKS